jgi:hypothetical protein
MIDEYNLVGKSYTFPDGNTIKVIQIKMRDYDLTSQVEPFVTFLVKSGPGIPKKEVMRQHDFLANFGHLFGITDPPNRPSR